MSLNGTYPVYQLDTGNADFTKRMLYDFYQNENSKKPNSVNATYVITGVQHPPEPPATNGDTRESDGDDIMQSSPYISSSMPNQDTVADTITSSIILAREEDLEGNAATNHADVVPGADDGYRCQIDISVNFFNPRIQSTTRSLAGPQCLDGCQP